MKHPIVLVVITAALLHIVGCAGTKTFSNAARAGDSIVVAIGATKGMEYFEIADVTATVIDSSGMSHIARVNNISRVYADPLSLAAVFNPDLEPTTYQGQWMAIVDLVDPTGTPLPLDEGSATVQLTHLGTSLFEPGFAGPTLTIIPGTGSPHTLDSTHSFGYSVASMLIAEPYVAIETAGTSSQVAAAASFIIQFNAATFKDPNEVRAVKLSQDPNVQLIASKRDLGNGWWEMTVILMNPHGFDAVTAKDLKNSAKSLPKDLSFVFSWPNFTNSSVEVPQDIELISADYVDINGDPISSLTASLGGGFGYN